MHRDKFGIKVCESAVEDQTELCDDRVVPRFCGSDFGGGRAMHSDQPSAESNLEVADEVDEAALASVMRTIPLGAGVLAGSAVALLVLGYLLIYLLVFIPRGTVG